MIPKKTKRKMNQRKTKRKIKRKTNRKTNQRKMNRKQRGGKFNDIQLADLTTILKEIGFTDAELPDFIDKLNFMSQHLLSGHNDSFNLFYHMIRENFLHNKEGLITWVNVQHGEQLQRSPQTDKEYSDDSGDE